MPFPPFVESKMTTMIRRCGGGGGGGARRLVVGLLRSVCDDPCGRTLLRNQSAAFATGSRICLFESHAAVQLPRMTGTGTGLSRLTEKPQLCDSVLPFSSSSVHNELQRKWSIDRCNVRSVATSGEEEKKTELNEKKSLDDFRHEEIVGPTVERDVSDTANELRESLDKMVRYVSKLRGSLVAMGALQLLSGWWIVATEFKADNLYFWFTGLSVTLSLQLAYLLHQTLKPVRFFQRIEDRSRMRVLTLSMQAIKAVSNFMGRANVIVCITASGLLVAFVYEMLPLLGYK